MPKDTNLSAQEIYEKEFHIDMRGYAPAEVDGFLDQVIEDYQAYEEEIAELSQLIQRYEKRINELTEESANLATLLDNAQSNGDSINASVNQEVDVLRRISKLEQAVTALIAHLNMNPQNLEVEAAD